MVESSGVQLITVRDASALLNVTRQTLYRWLREAGMEMPEPVRIGPRKSGFIRSEWEAWLKSRQRGLCGFAGTDAGFKAALAKRAPEAGKQRRKHAAAAR